MMIGKKTSLLLLAYCHFVNSDPAFSSFESQPDPDKLVSLLNQQYQEADIGHATLHQKLLEDQKVHLETLNSIHHQKTSLKNSFLSKKSSVESELHLIKKDIHDLKLKRKISKQQKAASKSEPPSNCFWSCSTGRPGKNKIKNAFTDEQQEALDKLLKSRKKLRRRLSSLHRQFEAQRDELLQLESEQKQKLLLNRQNISDVFNESLNTKTDLLNWIQKILNSRVKELKTEGDRQKSDQKATRNLVSSLNRDYVEKFSQISDYTGLSDQDAVDKLCENHPKAALFFYTMLNHLSTNLQIYLSLSTDKIAFATDKTAQTAQMIGKAVDLVPVISGVGGVAEAIVVYENGRRKQKRARNVFRTMGNAFRMHQIARKICLKVSKNSIETISTMSRKEISSFGFKAAKAVQRIISGSSGSESDRLSTSELAEQIFVSYRQILANRKKTQAWP